MLTPSANHRYVQVNPFLIRTSCNNLLIVSQLSVYRQFKEESCLLWLWVFDGVPKSVIFGLSFSGSFCCSYAKYKNGLLLSGNLMEIKVHKAKYMLERG